MIVISRDAEADTHAAYDWYEKQREKLGQAFLMEVERTLILISRQPESYPTVQGMVRRALCKRFPYAIYFLIKENQEFVLAVMHQRRNQIDWKKKRTFVNRDDVD